MKTDLPIPARRPFVFLIVSFFLVFTNISFLYLYPLALESMGGAYHVIGLVMGVFSVAAVVSRPLFGRLVSLKGESRVMSLGLAVGLAATLAYHAITAIGPAMLVVRVVHGIGFSAFISGSFSLAARAYPREKSGETFGIVGAAIMASMALAPPFGEFLVRRWGFHVLYSGAAAALVLAWIASGAASGPLGNAPGPASGKPAAGYRKILRDRPFFFLLLSTLILSHCQAAVPNFLAVIAAEKGTLSGPFFFLSSATAVTVLLVMGRFVDRRGKVFYLRISYPVFCLGLFLVPQVLPSAFFAVPAVLFGAGGGLLFLTHNTLAADHGSGEEKPAVMSLFTGLYDAGFITGAVISGWFAHETSLDMLFWACGALGLGGFLLSLFSPLRRA